jgi:hypothetical protein
MIKIKSCFSTQWRKYRFIDTCNHIHPYQASYLHFFIYTTPLESKIIENKSLTALPQISIRLSSFCFSHTQAINIIIYLSYLASQNQRYTKKYVFG